MILQTRAAKIILSIFAGLLSGCAIFVAVTGWDGTTTTSVSTSATESVSVVSPVPEDGPPPPSPQTTEPSPIPAKTLSGIYIDPPLSQVEKGQLVSVNLSANLIGSGISGCEITLQFDPTVFQIEGVYSSDLLGVNPLIGTETKDNTAGTVHYAIARKGLTHVTDSAGVLATYDFKVLDSAESGFHNISLGKIILTDHEFTEITGFEVQTGSVEVLP